MLVNATAERTETRSRIGPARRVAVMLPYAPLIAAGVLYGTFIGRSGFTFEGRRYYALFDDAMISMTYARNFAEGHGLVWNAGQQVEGYTNLLWTCWMALVHLLPLGDRTTSLAVMISEAALLIGTLLVVRAIARLLAPGARQVEIVALLLTGLWYPLAFWALRGMEVGLATLLVSVAVLLALRMREQWTARRCWSLAAVLVAAVLTRDDLLIPAIVVLAFLAWQLPARVRIRTLVTAGGALAVAIGAHEAFRLAYYDSALPNTYYLKLSGISIGTRVHRGAVALGFTSLYTLYAPLVLAGAALLVRRRGRTIPPALLLLAAVFAAECAYSVYVGGDAWEATQFANRYLTPGVPLLMVLAAIGIHETLRRGLRVAVPVAVALVAAGLVAAADPLSTTLLGFPQVGGSALGRLLPALACAGAIVAALLAARRLGSRALAIGALAAGLAVLVAVNGKPAADWARNGIQDQRAMRDWVLTGVALRDHTAPGTTVAVVGAGSTPYFAHRTGVDLLGKMDTVIAHEPPQPVPLLPGHNKWDYAHSIGALRPDVLVQVWSPSPADLCHIASWGYRQTAPQFFVRNGAGRVDEPSLSAAVRTFDAFPSFAPARNCAAAG